MTRTRLSLAIGLTACFSALAGCATPATPQTAALAEGQIADDGSVVACRNIAVTGSRFPMKDCKSEKAWAELDAILASNAKDATDKFQRVNSGCSTGGTC